MCALLPAGPPPARRPPRRPPSPPRPLPRYEPLHALLICVAAPALAISTQQGELTGKGLDGFYRSGRRILSRCHLLLGGEETVPLQGRMSGAGRARFVAAARPGPESRGPDPDLTVVRLREAEGIERITLHSAAGTALRVPVEVRLGTDLAELSAVAVGRAEDELPAAVHDAGLSWSRGPHRAVVTAVPHPDTALAAAGVLRWEVEVPPGGSATLTLTVRLESAPVASAHPPVPHPALPGPRAEHPARPWAAAEARCDDPRVDALLRTALEDLDALLLKDRAHPGDLFLAAGAPWRCALAPAESLRAARMLLPLGTRLAAGTLRILARSQSAAGERHHGRIPGPLRQARPGAPPSCSGTEATLLFPATLAEAYRWGLPERDLDSLLPALGRCLSWLRGAAEGEAGYVPDPGPGGPYRAEVQALAHRAAVLGADLLDATGQPGGAGWREWAGRLREHFHEDFWQDDEHGGRPVSLRRPDGSRESRLTGSVVELLDRGLGQGGEPGAALLDKVRTEQVARLLGGSGMDSGWGLRSLGTGEAGHNAFGHRSGAVRPEESASAVSALAVAGFEREAASLLHGMLGAAERFDHRLPEMYAAPQWFGDGSPVPHPAACRPAAVAAAGALQALLAVAGVRPDAPGGTVSLRPMRSAPVGAVQFTGLRVAEQPFAVRIGRLGTGVVEEAAEGLQLGV